MKTKATKSEQVATGWLVHEAIRRGELIRQPCEVCGTIKNIQAHHDDYDQPLSVRWLCASHHARHHRSPRKVPLIVREILPPGITKRQRRYIATYRHPKTGKAKHLGFFPTVQEAVATLALKTLWWDV